MTTRKAAPSGQALVDNLMRRFGTSPKAGATVEGEIPCTHFIDGDLVAEVKITFRRAVTTQAVTDYRKQALAYLAEKERFSKRDDETNAHLAVRCCCHVETRHRGGGKSGGQCQSSVTSVIVMRDTWPKDAPNSYHFVCGLHQEKHGWSPERVLAVIGLSRFELAPFVQKAAVEAAARDKRRREEEAERKRIAQIAFAEPAGVPMGWTYDPGTNDSLGRRRHEPRPRWVLPVRDGYTVEVELTDEFVAWEISSPAVRRQFEVVDNRAIAFGQVQARMRELGIKVQDSTDNRPAA